MHLLFNAVYDPRATLEVFDNNWVGILALCGLAMAFNYTWFVLAALRGARDQAYPIPLFSTLFWLCGDGTGILRYDLYFHVYAHWYLKLFWCALLLTVTFEILFLYQTFKYGRRELALQMNRFAFGAMLLFAAITFATVWNYLLGALSDDLNVIYFNLANMAGPIAGASMILRRRSIAGTSSLIWIFYVLMLVSWYGAQVLYFGAPFRQLPSLLFFAVNITGAVALALYVRSVERRNAAGGPISVKTA